MHLVNEDMKENLFKGFSYLVSGILLTALLIAVISVSIELAEALQNSFWETLINIALFVLGLIALFVTLLIITSCLFWAIASALCGLASLFAMLASIIRFEILHALGYCIAAGASWLIIVWIDDYERTKPR
jgi:hypothetical protein